MTAGERHERFGTGRDPRGAGVPASPGTRPYGTWRRRFPGADRSVSEARKWARGLLAERVAAPVLDDVLLLLSEVVTNAVTHSDSGRDQDGRVTVRMTRDAGGVRVEVRDGGSAVDAPVMRAPDAEAAGGRGLWLVDGLATAWGSWQDDTGASVWFRVAARR
ncbi:ATP-binding protein [Microbispora sp. H10670]|uniref:ATP-binding protein n=1 Tax=Microbispora sp. H10670 TaxID=2729108 RepID=UPI001602D78A|nr:ATP-binding protein [Microbispora sp. H10670]